jgi:hypothetical protein
VEQTPDGRYALAGEGQAVGGSGSVSQGVTSQANLRR